MFKNVSNYNPGYPSNIGSKWTDDEEKLLLKELDDENIDIYDIAKKHGRTPGGIIGRQQDIAYRMHEKNLSMDEIVKTTKLNEEEIRMIIDKKQKSKKKIPIEQQQNKILGNKNNFSLESEIIEMKKDIKQLKNKMNELIIMMKAIYEFEDSKKD